MSMSRFKNFVGISTSKHWFDAALIKSGNSSQIIRHQFVQDTVGFKQMQEWLQMFQVQATDDTLFCIEHTSLYNTGIVNHLVKYNAQLSVRISLRSLHNAFFEKKIDEATTPVTIARFALRYHDAVKLWQPTDGNMEKINQLTAHRHRIADAVETFIAPVKELRNSGKIIEARQVERNQKKALAVLHKTKFNIERAIAKTVKQDEQLYKKVKLVQSVKDFGIVTAWSIIGSYKKLLQLR
jgi:transposase